MKTIRIPQRPSFASAHALPLAVAAATVSLGLILAGWGLRQPPTRTITEAAAPTGRPHVVVDGATASHLAAEHPWTSDNVSPVEDAPNQPGFVSVDGATASNLAASHPWTNVIPSPENELSAAPRYVSVDSGTASRLAAEHPWTSEAACQVYDATGSVQATIVTIDETFNPPLRYSFVSVDSALASHLAAAHPWLGGSPRSACTAIGTPLEARP